MRSILLPCTLALASSVCGPAQAAGSEADHRFIEQLARMLPGDARTLHAEATVGQAIPECVGIPLDSLIPNYDGLTGAFLGTPQVVVDRPVSISFQLQPPMPDTVLAQGTFLGVFTSATGMPQTRVGTFTAVPDNPMVGTLLLLQTNLTTPEPEYVFAVLGLLKDLSGSRITGLCLQGPIRAGTPIHRPFGLYRTM